MVSLLREYNTFPWPTLDEAAKAKLTETGKAILAARANHPVATLAELYDPLLMPADLRRAHQANDRAVDRLYIKAHEADPASSSRKAVGRAFESDRDRVEHLFMLYERLTAPLAAKAAQKPKRGRKRKADA